MRILAAVLSTVFFLLLLLATAAAWVALVGTIDELGPQVLGSSIPDTVAMMLACLLLALPNWGLFRLLDGIYRRVHPGVDEASWGMARDPDTRFTLVQAVASALRSAALCLAVPSVALGLLIVLIVPFVLLASEQHDGSRATAVLGGELLLIVLLGWLVEWRYGRATVRLMQQRSGVMSDARRAARHTRAGKETPQIRVHEAADPIPVSDRRAEMQRVARRLRRLESLRDTGAPLAALAGILAVSWFMPAKELGSLRVAAQRCLQALVLRIFTG